MEFPNVPDPATLRLPVMNAGGVKLRCPMGAPPPPMPAVRHGGGFPKAGHRGERRYTRRGASRDAADAGEKAADDDDGGGGAFVGNTDELAGGTPPTAPGGEGFGEDGISLTAMEKGMTNDKEGKMLAVAAVALRSRSAPVRTGCLSRLLEIDPEALRRQVAESDPTVTAQFILALRLALDAPNPTHQADVIRVLAQLVDRDNETGWGQLLDLTTASAATTPLASWYEERTIFGLGVSSLDQPLNPIRSVPTASPWDAIQSVGELASVTKCDVLEAIGRTQYATRLRWLYANPRPETPWMQDTILRCLRSLTLSRIAGEAVAAVPNMIETLVKDVSPQAAAVKERPSDPHTELSRSTLCLDVLANLAKVSNEVADVVKECGGFAKASAVVMAVVADTKAVAAGGRRAHVAAALRLLRVGVLVRAANRHTVPSLFSVVCMLMRQRVAEAAWLLDAHAAVYGIVEEMEGQQQVGLIDFILRDAPCLLAATPAAAAADAAKAEEEILNYTLFAPALFSLMERAVRAVPPSVGMMDTIIAAINTVATSFTDVAARPVVDDPGLYALFRAEADGALSAAESRANAARWPALTDALRAQVVRAAYHGRALQFMTQLGSGGTKMAAVETAARKALRKMLDAFAPQYNEVLEGDYNGLAVHAARHAGLPKRLSRRNAAILRSTLMLAAAVATARVHPSGHRDPHAEAPPAAELWAWRAVSLNLSLYVQPCDAALFGDLLHNLFDPAYPRVLMYFKGSYGEDIVGKDIAPTPAAAPRDASNDTSKKVRFSADTKAPAEDAPGAGAVERPRAQHGLMMRYTPGRLEPQVEWPFLVAVDVGDESRGEPVVGRMLRVTTAHGVTPEVLAEWGLWLGEFAAALTAHNLPSYLTRVHWREAVLRTACVLCQCDAPTYNALLPYLRLVVDNRAECEEDTAAAAPGAANALVAQTEGPQSAWEKRLVEAPLQLAKRLLHAYEADGVGDNVFAAVVLLLLEKGFPKIVRRAAAECLSVPQLAHVAGGCFEDSMVHPLYLGVHAYLGSQKDDFDESPNSAEDARTTAGVLSRGVDPRNVLHIRAVHHLAKYLFDDPADGTLTFLAEDTFALLPPPALRAVTLYAPPSTSPSTPATALPEYLPAHTADPATDPAAAARVASVKQLGLRAFAAAFP